MMLFEAYHVGYSGGYGACECEKEKKMEGFPKNIEKILACQSENRYLCIADVRNRLKVNKNPIILLVIFVFDLL